MITPRLDLILKHTTGKTVADVGTDHAYIPIALAERNKISYAIASDIKPGPLKIATDNIEKYGFSDIIKTVLAPGTEHLQNNETESLIIAGMGGEMIIKILSENIEKSHSFAEIILQPMNFQAELRMWLQSHNFNIYIEDLAKEGFKIYNLIKITKNGDIKYTSEIEYHLPPCLYEHPLFESFKNKKIREFTKILNGLKSAKIKDFELIDKYTYLLEETEKCF